MQTFLPYPDFKESAKVLDRARLDRLSLKGHKMQDCLVKCPICSFEADYQALSNSVKCHRIGFWRSISQYCGKYQFLTKFASTNLKIISEIK
jgi:hypothetical protein